MSDPGLAWPVGARDRRLFRGAADASGPPRLVDRLLDLVVTAMLCTLCYGVFLTEISGDETEIYLIG